MHSLMALGGAGKDNEFLGYFLSTHPVTGERIEAISLLLDKIVEGPPVARPRARWRVARKN